MLGQMYSIEINIYWLADICKKAKIIKKTENKNFF
jgi:hypothetical protein